jgi:hypothetical protein
MPPIPPVAAPPPPAAAGPPPTAPPGAPGPGSLGFARGGKVKGKAKGKKR